LLGLSVPALKIPRLKFAFWPLASWANVPFRTRFKAWWEGSEIVVRRRDGEAKPEERAPRRAIGYRDPARPWETPRVVLLQSLWGEGFAFPGGREHAATLVKPFALNLAMTVIDMHAGLGGGARAMVEDHGIWVTGFAPDHELALAGAEMSHIAGMAKKAAINAYVPDKFEFRPGSCDCMLARELFFTIADKKRLLRQVASPSSTAASFCSPTSC